MSLFKTDVLGDLDATPELANESTDEADAVVMPIIQEQKSEELLRQYAQFEAQIQSLLELPDESIEPLADTVVMETTEPVIGCYERIIDGCYRNRNTQKIDFQDCETRIRVFACHKEAAEAIVQLAIQKGWDGINLEKISDPEQKRLLAAEAAASGIKVGGYALDEDDESKENSPRRRKFQP